MNREIRFRGWDEYSRRMLQPGEFDLYQESDNGFHAGYSEPGGDWVQLDLMQFTGLRDKNGNAIYEGDIIKLAKGTIRSIFAVPGGFAFECLDGDVGKYGKIQCCPFEPMGDEQNIGYIRTQTEVIGNIYENPELLVGV